MQYDFAGQVAVVTGGAHGIGRAVVEAFGRAGGTPVILDIDDAAGREAASRTGGLFVRTDVTDPSSVASAATSILGQLGRVDVLVNNAGSAGSVMGIAPAPVWDMPAPHVQALVALNFLAVVYCCHSFMRPMIEAKRGAVVNVSSTEGLVGKPTQAAYAASKAAVINLTYATAREAAPFGVRVNAIAPGAVATRIWDHQKDVADLDEFLAKRGVPLARAAQPAEMAEVVLFLASPAAAYITGECLPVDGGL